MFSIQRLLKNKLPLPGPLSPGEGVDRKVMKRIDRSVMKVELNVYGWVRVAQVID
jgi:hypothetical protein